MMTPKMMRDRAAYLALFGGAMDAAMLNAGADALELVATLARPDGYVGRPNGGQIERLQERARALILAADAAGQKASAGGAK
jgi:hypothetical protein